MTGQTFTNEYSKNEYMDEHIEDMKKEIVTFVKLHLTYFNTNEE